MIEVEEVEEVAVVVIKPEYNFQADYESKVSEENSLELIKKLPPLVSEKGALEIELRKAYGSQGTKTNVGTNHVTYSVANLKFWQYHVTFPAEIDAKRKVKNDLLEILLTKEPFSGLKNAISHNGSDALFSTAPIPLDDKTEKKVRFEFSRDEYLGVVPNSILKGGAPRGKPSKDKAEAAPETAAQAQYVVYCTVEFIHTLDMKELQNYVSLKDNNKIDPSPYIVALNVSLSYQITRAPNAITTGKNRFFFVEHPEKCQSFQKGLFIASGYFASILPTFNNVLVSIRPVAGAFIKSHNPDGTPMNVAQLVSDYYGEPLDRLSPDAVLREKSFFKNIRIQRTYLGSKSKPKAIFDISKEFDSNNYKFEVDGKVTTVAEYFKARYKIDIEHPELPLVHLGGSNYLPMEACTIVPGQEFTGEVTDVRGVLAFTTHRPHTIAGLTQKEGIEKIVDASHDKRMGKKLIVVPSRVISSPNILYKNKTISYAEKPADGKSEKKKGSWDLTNVQFYRPVKGKISLLVVCVSPRGRGLRPHEQDAVEDAVDEYVAECGRHGITLVLETIEEFEFSFPDRCAAEYTQFMKGYKGKIGYVLNIMPHLDKTLYAAVKKTLDVNLGIPNQCTLINKFTKQRFGKFDLQMYALMGMKASIKLGGVNHVLDDKSSAVVNQDGLPALILGADVSHPTGPNAGDGVSVASVVGSYW
ncbi:unnamed protein product [Ambrosiozyma monospora]|uniref:Unnamed protein product n=1 Tax=Ambrosiozyma monospora TaxID=43982 RepID=A0ACB5T2X3_AMBMO|nr:unnamed protein product [Ambrosiozyma monospora]